MQKGPLQGRRRPELGGKGLGGWRRIRITIMTHTHESTIIKTISLYASLRNQFLKVSLMCDV